MVSNVLTTAGLCTAQHWLRPDLRLVGEKHRDETARRCDALAAVLQGASLRRAAERHDVNRRTLSSVIEKAFQIGHDGRPLGYRACLPYSNSRASAHVAKEMPTHGSAHALQQLFDVHPDIKQMLESYKGALPPGHIPPGFGRLIGSIRVLLIERGCQAKWPLNTADKGRRAFTSYVRRIRRQAIVDGAPTEPIAELATIQRIDQLFALDPFDRCEFDAHRIDVEWCLMVPNARGEFVPMSISEIWILAIIDAASTAILGWKIVVGKAYTALDVAQCFASAMRPWEPRDLIVPSLQYVPGAAMPSSLNMSMPVMLGRLTAMDNAKAHKAKLPLQSWLCAHYGVINFGLPHVPEARPHIETFFNRLEQGALRQLPGGFKPHRRFVEATKTSIWVAKDHPVHLQALEDLMDVVISGHNVSPIPARQNRTPIGIISTYQQCAGFWMAPPVNETNAKLLTTICVDLKIKGSKTRDKAVHVQFLGVDYRHLDMNKAWEMLGQTYKAIIDLEDLRTITLVDNSLRPIRTLKAADPWCRRRHDVTTRRRILKLIRSGELEIRGVACAIAAYAQFTASKAAHSTHATDQLARLLHNAETSYDPPPSNMEDIANHYARAKPLGGSTTFTSPEEFT